MSICHVNAGNEIVCNAQAPARSYRGTPHNATMKHVNFGPPIALACLYAWICVSELGIIFQNVSTSICTTSKAHAQWLWKINLWYEGAGGTWAYSTTRLPRVGQSNDAHILISTHLNKFFSASCRRRSLGSTDDSHKPLARHLRCESRLPP